MGSERDIDDAIDRAVRDIMSVEPQAGLRGRVLERIERPGARLFALPRLAGAGALAAIALISFLLVRPVPPPEQPELATNTVPAPVPDAGPPPETSRSARDTAAPPAAGPAAPPRQARRSAPRAPAPPPAPAPQFPPRGVVAAATFAGVPETAAATPEVVPLPLDPHATPIAIPAIHIEPLTIERIVIAPIPSVR